MSESKRSTGDAARGARRQPLEKANCVLKSRLENIDPVERTALEIAERAGFHGTELEKIGLAVHEIVTNAIIHGNHLKSRKRVVVTILRSLEELEVAVWDQGKGFDVQSLPDPLSPDALLMPRGRGVYLARSFMDEFHVQTGSTNGTTVTLIKYIRFDEPPSTPNSALPS
jgi:serine/threonine-protein kinase RsbW